MAQALDIKTGSPLTKLILLKLCDNANDAGECWPSQTNIAEQCETSRETVNRHIKKLTDIGLIIKLDQYRLGVQTVSKYMINLGVTESHSGCDSESPHGVTEDHTEPTIEPTIKEKIEKKKSEFKEEVKAKWLELGGKDYLPEINIKGFFNHWIEASKTGALRFEKETFWDMGKRIGYWKTQAVKFGDFKKPNPNVRQGGRI